MPIDYELVGFSSSFVATCNLPNFVYPTNEGHKWLRIPYCTIINSTEIATLPGAVEYYAATADMDADGDHQVNLASEIAFLDDDEGWHIQLGGAVFPATGLQKVNDVYQVLQKTSSINVARSPQPEIGLRGLFSNRLYQIRVSPNSLTGPAIYSGNDSLVCGDSGVGRSSFSQILAARPPAISANDWLFMQPPLGRNMNHQYLSNQAMALWTVCPTIHDVETRIGDLR